MSLLCLSSLVFKLHLTRLTTILFLTALSHGLVCVACLEVIHLFFYPSIPSNKIGSGMLKVNPDKTEFTIFESTAHLKKLDFHTPVRIMGNFVDPVIFVKNPSVWFGAFYSSLIMSTIFARLASLKYVVSGGLGSI